MLDTLNSGGFNSAHFEKETASIYLPLGISKDFEGSHIRPSALAVIVFLL